MRPTFHVRCVATPKVQTRSFLRASTTGRTLRPRLGTVGGPSGAFASHTGTRRFLATGLDAEPNFYDDLGVPPTATINEIKKRYYQLSKQHHPDIAGQHYDEAAFHRIQVAYETLSEPTKKRAYDRARASPQQASSAPSGGFTQTSGQTARARKRRETLYTRNETPINVGFTPRASWDPEFRKFFDDLSQRMKENGINIETLTYTNTTRQPPPELLRELMDGDLLGSYLKKRREAGKDPLSDIFMAHQGRHPAGMQWLQNRMTMLEQDESRMGTSRAAGGTWERGGAKRPTTARRPAYSTAYEDGMAGAAFTTSSTSGFGAAPREPVKRDYSKGHELDPRFEADRMQMVAREKRFRNGFFAIAAVVATLGTAKTFSVW